MGGDGGEWSQLCARSWWYCAFPGAAILLTAVGFNPLVMVFAICLTRKQEESSHDQPVLDIQQLHLSFPGFNGDVTRSTMCH